MRRQYAEGVLQRYLSIDADEAERLAAEMTEQERDGVLNAQRTRSGAELSGFDRDERGHHVAVCGLLVPICMRVMQRRGSADEETFHRAVRWGQSKMAVARLQQRTINQQFA